MACEPQKSEPVKDRSGRQIRFQVTPLGFKSGRRVFVRVAKAVGPALAVLADRSASLDLAAAARTVIESVSDEDLEWLAGELEDVSAFSADGGPWVDLTPANREALFSGNLALFFRWIVFSLEVQFSDFSDALRSARAAAAPEGGTRKS